MNTLTEKRSKISRFGKIALLGIIFGAALALMFALTALAEEPPESTETTPPIEEPVVEETTPPVEEPLVEETTAPEEEPVVEETTAPEEGPVVDETTVPESEPVEENVDVNSEVPAGPVVTTDKTYYNPGEQVNVTGSGFQPGEDVSISFVDLNGVAETNQTITADESGSITLSYNILGSANYQVIATGVVSGTSAQTSFEDDSVKVTLEGWDLTPNDKWSTGQISGYYEGESIPFKLEIEGLSTGLKTVTINHDYYNGSAIGINYLTDYPASAPYDPATNTDPDGPFGSLLASSSQFTVLGNVSDITNGWVILGDYLIGTISFNVLSESKIYITWGAHLSNTAADWPGATLHVQMGEDGKTTVPIAVREAGTQTEGIISGFKFEDVNGNGKWDKDEPALEGWTINLKLDDKIIASTITDEEGYYEFTGLEEGTYSLSELLEDGWMLTVGPKNVVIAGSTNDKNNNFGNFKLGIIEGYKFWDFDGDGVWDVDEPAIEGWDISLYKWFDCESKTVATDEYGKFTFTGLEHGFYTLWEEKIDGWYSTTRDFYFLIKLPRVSGSVLYYKFGNRGEGEICGFKFNDLDGNGTWDKDKGEPVLEGWTINLKFGEKIIASKLTDSDGKYCFIGLGPGSYEVSESLQTDWTQTYPVDPAYHELVIKAWTTGRWWCKVWHWTEHRNINFGNFYTGGGPGGGPTPSLAIAGITEIAGVKRAGALKVAGITELPFTGSNLVLVYLIAILMIISGTAILASSRKIKVNRARL